LCLPPQYSKRKALEEYPPATGKYSIQSSIIELDGMLALKQAHATRNLSAKLILTRFPLVPRPAADGATRKNS
jgi:hypothetical protein